MNWSKLIKMVFVIAYKTMNTSISYCYWKTKNLYNIYSISNHTFNLTASTTISPLRTETRLTTRSLLSLLRPSRYTKLESSVQPLLQMRIEWRNSTWRRCGSHQMEPSETFLMVPSSESQLFARTFQDSFQAGINQLLLVDTPMLINTWLLMQL